jgi:hypothetical protein
MAITTKVLPCKCSNPFQDKEYAFGYRLHNKCAKEDTWRCTVCGTEHTVSGSILPKKKSK